MAPADQYLTLQKNGKYMIGPPPNRPARQPSHDPTRSPPSAQPLGEDTSSGLPNPVLQPHHSAFQPQTPRRRGEVAAQSSTYASPGVGSPVAHREMPFDLRNRGASHVRDDDENTETGKDESRKGSGGESGGEGNDEKNDDKEGGSPPTPVGFWDPSLNHVRKEAITKWAIITVILSAFILSVLSIYWASLYHVERNISSLVVAVVDFDGQAPFEATTPIVGPLITRLAVEQAAMPHQLGYVSVSASVYNNDPIQVRQAVYNFDFWAAIIINPNATAMLYSAIQNGNMSYDPLGACQLIYQDARDDTNWYDFIYPLISTLLTQATSSVGEQWTSTALSMASSNATILSNLQRVPQALSPAIGFSMYNLRPFYPYQSIPAVSIGLIYLIILSFFSFPFYLPIHGRFLKPEGHPPLKFYQLIIWRWLATITAYFFLSCAYSLVSLAFQINFSGGNPVTSETSPTLIEYNNPDAYGKGTFPVYWMLNYVGMGALGLACENVAMLIGQPWTGLWLIFWVITNVCTSFYDIDIEPAFFRWGYAWPLHNIVEGSRQIIFGLHSRIGLNFGILFAWVAINTALFPLCCLFLRWKTQNNVKVFWE